jgi:hypothetical protein
MYWLELSGHNFEGELGVERISTPFQTIDEAVSKAKELAGNNTFYWGKATRYKITDKYRILVREGSFRA